MMPSQKLGIDRPASPMRLTAWSTIEPRQSAARTPAGIPRTSAISMDSSRELDRNRQPLGDHVPIGRRVRTEVPKSPCRNALSHVAY